MTRTWKFALALLGSTLAASPALAATVQLDAVTPTGSNFLFSYGGSLAPTEGITSGSQLVIFDFAGYIDGSINAVSPFITASTSLVSSGLTLAPGVTDDPTLINLIFTYNGPDFQTTPAPVGSPYAPISFDGLTALSMFSGITTDGFSALTVKNSGLGSVGTTVYSQGQLGVPLAAPIPEPSTWAMLLVGFSAVGYSLRRRRTTRVNFA